jgi:hypothetical protein
MKLGLKVGDKVRIQDWVFADPIRSKHEWISSFQDCVGVVYYVWSDGDTYDVFWFSPNQESRPRFTYSDLTLVHLGSFLEGVDDPEVEVRGLVSSWKDSTNPRGRG